MPFEARPSRRVLVIFNPTAGPRRRRKLMRVVTAVEAMGCSVTLRETGAPGDAEAMARAADPKNVDLVVAAGGDGTINEVINGLGDSDLPLALIPLGTANVLATEIGLAHRADALARAIATGTPHAIHLGQADGRRFIMMLGIGIDARIVAGVDPRLKKRAGKLAYVMSGIATVWHDRPARYQFEIDGKPYTAAAAIIAKGRHYAGGFVLARDARLAAPSFQIVLLERPGRWNLLRYGAAIALGRLHRLRGARIIEARRIVVRGPEGEHVQADGDLAGTLPLTITIADRPLALVGA